MDVHIGCSGWVYPHWREVFYPKGVPQRAWLAYYAEHFDTVEVNNTFYRLPKPAAVQGWAEHSPPGFTFAVKVSRYLTHIKRLTMIEAGMKRFYEPLEPLTSSEKLGPLLWQFPPNFHRDTERLSSALAELPPGRHAFEFRHGSWFTNEVYDLLRAHGVALVIGLALMIAAFTVVSRGVTIGRWASQGKLPYSSTLGGRRRFHAVGHRRTELAG